MPDKTKKPLSRIAAAILEVLQQSPEGLDIVEIRDRLRLQGVQQHLDRRLRELDPLYIIERSRRGNRTVYRYVGERPEGEWDYEDISKELRAKVLVRDGSRCQMCGRTVERDQIRLHIDHKIPRSWGGKTVEENLWTLCEPCNEGKKNYFASFDPVLMQQVMGYASVHERIAYLLQLKMGEWVQSDLIEFVANYQDYQADWQKRLRELRYLGLDIEVTRGRIGSRIVSSYRLTNWVNLPADVDQFIRNYEIKRARENRARYGDQD